MLTTKQLLEFEARYPNHPSGKQQAIEAELGLTSARYYQLLGRAIDTPEAAVLDPMLVHRLRRLRSRAESRLRSRQRTA
ncbi:DUF3263 domain-containing protein [Microbacterium sp. NPDC080220]|uniref:DUF3263 domain-containing protein n=1 Tax=Microbacterium sp. NPDC080220 TaxID=3161017 RepID=UPI003444E34A